MKTALNKITGGAFGICLFALISSGCEDTFSTTGDDSNHGDTGVDDDIPDYVEGINLEDYYLLRATFEGDAIPGQPDKTLPGYPHGDELKYDDGTGTIVLYAGTGSQKSIYLAPNQPGNEFEKTEFISKPGSNEGIVTIAWEGQLVGHYLYDTNPDDYIFGNGYGTQRVTITNGVADTLVYMKIVFNDFYFVYTKPNKPNHYLGGGASNFFLLQAGSLPHTWIPTSSQHKIIITCNLHSQTFDAKFIRDDGITETVDNSPFYEPYTPLRGPRFTMEMVRPKTFSNTASTYILDWATIGQHPARYTGPPIPPF